MSNFARMQEAWEAALEGEIERSFRLADEAGVTVIDRAMVRRKVYTPPDPITAEDLVNADVEAWGEGFEEGWKEAVDAARDALDDLIQPERNRVKVAS
jgi:hypothetical protein